MLSQSRRTQRRDVWWTVLAQGGASFRPGFDNAIEIGAKYAISCACAVAMGTVHNPLMGGFMELSRQFCEHFSVTSVAGTGRAFQENNRRHWVGKSLRQL